MFDVPFLQRFSRGFNQYIKETNKNIPPINISSDKQDLLSQLEDRFNQIGGLSEKSVRDVNAYVMPEGPSKPTEWLGNGHIKDIMDKYEQRYPGYRFIGALPVDCDAYKACPLLSIDFDKEHKIGIIFNTDKLGQPGEHWVSMFIDVDNCKLYFSDSGGKPPRENMNNMVTRFREWTKKKGCAMQYFHNTKSYQKDNTECGIYSINFIVSLLRGDKYENIIANAPNFEEINSCRNVYFGNNPSKYSVSSKC